MFDNFKRQIGKLMKYVDEETNLRAEVNADSYPLRISFYKDAEQLTLFQESGKEEETIDAATGKRIIPRTTFEFFTNMRIVTEGKFKIADAIFSKLKSLSKEANRIFLNEFCEAMITVRRDLRELGWAEQIGGEIDSCDGVQRILCIVNPNVLVEYLDWTRNGSVHGADVSDEAILPDEIISEDDEAEEFDEEGDEEPEAEGDTFNLADAAERAAELAENAERAYKAATLEDIAEGGEE